MLAVLPLSPRLTGLIKKHNLSIKFSKQLGLLKQNPRYPSLHVELLEPRAYGIYSFRIDLKYRALFIFRPDKQAIEILEPVLKVHIYN